jgi:hypothetical protein
LPRERPSILPLGGECHTPRNFMMGLKNGKQFAGEEQEGWLAYNLLPLVGSPSVARRAAETANAAGAHLSECDLLLAGDDGGHADIEARFLGSDLGRELVNSEALANGGGVRATRVAPHVASAQ